MVFIFAKFRFSKPVFAEFCLTKPRFDELDLRSEKTLLGQFVHFGNGILGKRDQMKRDSRRRTRGSVGQSVDEKQEAADTRCAGAGGDL